MRSETYSSVGAASIDGGHNDDKTLSWVSAKSASDRKGKKRGPPILVTISELYYGHVPREH